jgi:hypothetical protein
MQVCIQILDLYQNVNSIFEARTRAPMIEATFRNFAQKLVTAIEILGSTQDEASLMGYFFQLMFTLFCVCSEQRFCRPLIKLFLWSKLPCLGWRSADFLQSVLSPIIYAGPRLVIVLRFLWSQQCTNLAKYWLSFFEFLLQGVFFLWCLFETLESAAKFLLSHGGSHGKSFSEKFLDNYVQSVL